jgi:Protein kinase domain
MVIASKLITFNGAQDFEIRAYVGSLGFKTIVDWEYFGDDVSPLAPTRTVDNGGVQVRIFDARYVGDNPRLFNTRVSLREFLPDGLELARNEALAYQRLYDSKGTDRMDPNEIPVATLLGSFLADDSFDTPSFAAMWASRFPRAPISPAPGAPFLVFRWEGNVTAARLPASAAAGDSSAGGKFLDRYIFPAAATRRTREFLIALMRKSLAALLFLHTAGIVHRSLSSSSILCNTVETRMAPNLEVKIRDFGFARAVSDLATGDNLREAQRAGASSPSEISSFFFAEDILSLGYAFCELIFGSLIVPGSAGSSSLPDSSQDRIKALYEDTFDSDIAKLREYMSAEDAWAPAITFLDGQSGDWAGWGLLSDMLGARSNFRNSKVSVEDIAKSTLLQT